MTHLKARSITSAVAAALALTLAGCPKQRSTMRRAPQVNPPPPVETSAEVRIDELGDRARQFRETAERLPGRSQDEHRALVQQALADLSQVLPILFGPNPTGVQRQQLRVVESSRAQLAAAPKGLAPEPTIGTGLRAARDALSSLGRGSYFDQPELAKILDRIDKSVSDLDAARGTNHQQVVAETVERMSDAVGQMAKVLDERLGSPDAPVEPTPEPTPEPAPVQ